MVVYGIGELQYDQQMGNKHFIARPIVIRQTATFATATRKIRMIICNGAYICNIYVCVYRYECK